jgi:hypothetical protein
MPSDESKILLFSKLKLSWSIVVIVMIICISKIIKSRTFQAKIIWQSILLVILDFLYNAPIKK